MLHILLLILKIIGIVLLCVLGILFLGIVCAFFVPVRYRIEAVRKEGEGEPPVAVTVKVTWLLHFVNVLACFAGSLSVRARLALFTVFRLPGRKKRGGKEKRAKAGEKQGKEKRTKPEDTASADIAEPPGSGENGEKSNTEPQKSKETGREAGTELSGSEETGRREETEPAADAERKISLWDRLRAVWEAFCNIFVKIKSIFENIQYTIQKFCDKIGAVSDTIVYYKGVIEGEAFQRSFALCKGELLSITKSMKPDRFEAQLIVGMDDPAVTGEILAVCGMLYPILGPRVNVAGDFEKRRLEGRVFIKGKLRLFTFVRAAVRIYFNKDIRKLYGLLKKEAV